MHLHQLLFNTQVHLELRLHINYRISHENFRLINLLIYFIMNERSRLLGDLTKLQRYQSRLQAKDSQHYIGFNQKKIRPSNKLTSLEPNNHFTALLKKQQEVLKEIRQIDIYLKNKHQNFRYHHGFLFKQGVTSYLSSHFAKTISNNIQTIESGFAIWRLFDEDGGVKLKSGRLAKCPPQFNQKLTDKSLENIEKFTQRMYEQSLKHGKKPWQYFSRRKGHSSFKTKTQAQQPEKSYLNKNQYLSKGTDNIKDINQRRKYTQADSSSVLIESQISALQKYMISQSKLKSHFNSDTPIAQRRRQSQHSSFSELQPTPSKQQLNRMLLKQNNIVSVWVPPSNYPQLFAILTVQIREKEVGLRICWISKYFFIRHTLSCRFFNCLIDWISHEFNYVQELYLSTTKTIFQTIFSQYSWQIIAWISDTKCRIAYKRSLL